LSIGREAFSCPYSQKAHASTVFSGNAFIPILLFPENAFNLHVSSLGPAE